MTSFPHPAFNASQSVLTANSPQHVTANQVPANPDVLIQGLNAMQQLQAQTARAHEKFLETQAQASQTLAQMMAQTRSTTQFAPAAQPMAQPAAQPVEPAAVSEPPVQAAPDPIPVQTPAPTPVIDPAQAPEAIPAVKKETGGIQALLFETVSRLTGFPVEMLEPGMDIESDLGIDSIKKVEIISELEKQMPQGQGISPDHLASVRTLGDICEVMEQGQPAPVSSSVSAAPVPAAPAPAKNAPAENTFDVLVKVISDLTGFPVEMLEPSMNLESDLGIDSIKRVEILSKLEQEQSDLKAISPDEMGTLKTIEDIVRYLSSASPDNNQTSQGAPRPSKKKLRMKT